MKDIYELKLHESLAPGNGIQVTRVPGGWIYRFWNAKTEDYSMNGVFVPYTQKEELKEILIDFVTKKYEQIYWLEEGGFEQYKDQIPEYVGEFLNERKEN